MILLTLSVKLQIQMEGNDSIYFNGYSHDCCQL